MTRSQRPHKLSSLFKFFCSTWVIPTILPSSLLILFLCIIQSTVDSLQRILFSYCILQLYWALLYIFSLFHYVHPFFSQFGHYHELCSRYCLSLLGSFSEVFSCSSIWNIFFYLFILPNSLHLFLLIRQVGSVQFSCSVISDSLKPH